MGEIKLFIGLPINRHMENGFAFSLMQTIQASPGKIVLHPYVGDSLVGRARNAITRKFLESDCTHLLQIDSDVTFSVGDAGRMFIHDKDVVGGVYFKKQPGPPQAVCNALPPEHTKHDGELMTVKYIGTGFLRVARSVFERMVEKFDDELWYRPDQQPRVVEHDYWRVGVCKYPDGSRRYLSEDWYFCEMCARLGIPVWMDRGIVLKHFGGIDFPMAHDMTPAITETVPISGAEATKVADSPPLRSTLTPVPQSQDTAQTSRVPAVA